MTEVELRVDAALTDLELRELMQAAWGTSSADSFQAVLSRSLAYVSAHVGDRLVGFVNVATDGGIHASIFDTTVHPDHQRKGIGMLLVREAARAARERGARWLHVDFEPHLEQFYAVCGFRPTAAGLIDLQGPLA